MSYPRNLDKIGTLAGQPELLAFDRGDRDVLCRSDSFSFQATDITNFTDVFLSGYWSCI